MEEVRSDRLCTGFAATHNPHYTLFIDPGETLFRGV
jgi:hypothetical protein